MYSNIYLVPTTSQIINNSVNVYGYEYNDLLLDGVTALTNFFSNIGEISGPIFAGLLSDYFGFSTGFAIISGMSFILFLLFVRISNLKVNPKIMIVPDNTLAKKRNIDDTYMDTASPKKMNLDDTYRDDSATPKKMHLDDTYRDNSTPNKINLDDTYRDDDSTEKRNQNEIYISTTA